MTTFLDHLREIAQYLQDTVPGHGHDRAVRQAITLLEQALAREVPAPAPAPAPGGLTPGRLVLTLGLRTDRAGSADALAPLANALYRAMYPVLQPWDVLMRTNLAVTTRKALDQTFAEEG